MAEPTLPTPLAIFAEDVIGPALCVERLSRADAGGALVVAWHGRQGRGVLKAYRSSRPFVQERRAYREWTTDLPLVASVLAERPSPPRALLLEHLPGRAAGATSLHGGAERVVHRAAGAWLRRLHGVPFHDDDPVALPDAFAMRVRGWMETAGSAEAEAAARWAGVRLTVTGCARIDEARVPCHRDFSPRNWLVGPDGSLTGVVDFEHARSDHRLADLSRLAAYIWPFRPDLEAAFLAGYGRLDDDDRKLVQGFAALDAAQRLGWALRRGDRSLVASARKALRALGAPVSP